MQVAVGSHDILLQLLRCSRRRHSYAAEDAHNAFQLAVDPPADSNDSFRIYLAEELVGAQPGHQVSITYELIPLDPGGSSHVLLGPVSESSSFGGGYQSTNYGYSPRQNGQFAFRVVRLDGNQQTILAEQQLTTDQAVQLGPAPLPDSRPDGRFEITGLSIDPPQPSVGQTVTLPWPQWRLFLATSGYFDVATATLPFAFRSIGSSYCRRAVCIAFRSRSVTPMVARYFRTPPKLASRYLSVSSIQ